MRRYFYDSSPLIAKWLQKNAFAKSFEDSIYRSALLAAHKNSPSEQFQQLREKILDMTIVEQEKYATNSHIEDLFLHFNLLHKYAHGRPLVTDITRSNSTTHLVDPDKFPIWDLKKYAPIYKSMWGFFLNEIRFHIGHQMIIRESRVQHLAGGKGVFAILTNKKPKIQVGEFLGLVPGKIYENFNHFKSIVLKKKREYHRNPQYIHFPNGKILEFGDLPLSRKYPFGVENQSESDNNFVDGTYHNPYAVGHMINHPPPGLQPNVCFTEINLPINYFPLHLLKYLPYQYFMTDRKLITLYGIFAIKQIEHKEQLFVNYNQGHIYPIDEIPEWLIEPLQLSPIFQYLKKGQYELTEKNFWKSIEKRALKKNQELYEKYEKNKVYTPDKTFYEDKEKSFKTLKLKINQENEYNNL